MSLHIALNNSNDPIHINCKWCDWQLDLNQTDWCDNCNTSIFDDKMNNELSKLVIKNIHNTEGLNIEGISIDEWIIETDNYQFLAYAMDTNGCLNLNDIHIHWTKIDTD